MTYNQHDNNYIVPDLVGFLSDIGIFNIKFDNLINNFLSISLPDPSYGIRLGKSFISDTSNRIIPIQAIWPNGEYLTGIVIGTIEDINWNSLIQESEYFLYDSVAGNKKVAQAYSINNGLEGTNNWITIGFLINSRYSFDIDSCYLSIGNNIYNALNTTNFIN